MTVGIGRNHGGKRRCQAQANTYRLHAQIYEASHANIWSPGSTQHIESCVRLVSRHDHQEGLQEQNSKTIWRIAGKETLANEERKYSADTSVAKLDQPSLKSSISQQIQDYASRIAPTRLQIEELKEEDIEFRRSLTN